jgi:hypothetical protein
MRKALRVVLADDERPARRFLIAARDVRRRRDCRQTGNGETRSIWSVDGPT